MKLESLWDEHYEEIQKFVRRRTKSDADADDIVQNVFIKAYQGMSLLKEEDKSRAWLFQIARNCIVDHYRKARRTEPLPETMQLAQEEPMDDGDSLEAAEDMRSILSYLPEKYREALELADLKGMSQKQLSEYLNISYSGAKSRVQRGRELVKDMMNSCCKIVADPYGNIVEYRVVQDEPQVRKKAKGRQGEGTSPDSPQP